MSKRHVSLKDLARELNVSISTVSRALKDHPDISEEVRKKVKRLAAERNYSPNPLAMGLLKQATRMIGIIVPDLVTHFYSSIISGIESVAKEKGYFVVIASSNEKLEKEKESIANLLQARVEGLIICMSRETTNTEHLEQLLKADIPLVMFDRVCLTNQISAVIADNADASQKIVAHFYSKGYRRIAYVSGPDNLSISKERMAGYLTGLEACGLPIDAALIETCDLTFESAQAAMNRLLQLPIPPDAVFGINDTVAFGLMKAIKTAGLRIPHDMGVVGFTDEFHSTVVDPPLTSVTHPTFEMGQKTAELFFKRLHSAALSETVILETKLVERESSEKPQ
ncbi:LacI family DNA-binding transcriptional regulator [Mangrovibacterium diazotrophicum]|uniref:LacI family transcriptional regulator n=1 Tax=Mangrovibacterium diazotrophicum TaxID=1261403 RepID=A0A419W324_9BACT|nr:LacI family DNA-binding transcriptional regulator [Mangrovibacterium diazotrophicum]RKD89881.1 LacI family transcriptional regulator [Mangrovibacterium diazotrophicum]